MHVILNTVPPSTKAVVTVVHFNLVANGILHTLCAPTANPLSELHKELNTIYQNFSRTLITIFQDLFTLWVAVLNKGLHQ